MTATTTPPAQPQKDHLLSDKAYFLLNNAALVVLPALGTLYAALAVIWGLPAGKEVVGTIIAVDTFLGVLVKVGETSYDNSGAKYAGTINVSDTPEKTTFSLDLNTHPDDLKNATEASFKVQNNPPLAAVAAAPTPATSTTPPAPPSPPVTPSQ